MEPSSLSIAEEAHEAAKFGATLVSACICEKEHSTLKNSPPGKLMPQNICIIFPFMAWHIFCTFLSSTLVVAMYSSTFMSSN